MSFWHTIDYIIHCGSNGIVFNPEKFHFAEKEVEFAGFQITEDGIKPTKRMTEGISSFPTPKNITDVRSWSGQENQVSYAFSQAEIMALFWELLKTKDQKFYWDDTLDKIFEELKLRIRKEIENGVNTFEINRPTCLSTDFSRTGIGYFLFQGRTSLCWGPLEVSLSQLPVHQQCRIKTRSSWRGGIGTCIWTGSLHWGAQNYW